MVNMKYKTLKCRKRNLTSQGKIMDVKQDQIDAARRELYEFNDASRTLESCIKDMRLQYERLKKNVADANEEIAALKRQLEKYELIY